MMIIANSKFKSVAAASAVFLITSCATQGGKNSDVIQQSSSECNPAVAGIIGALIGGFIAGGKDTVRGAAVGGAIGALACVVINTSSRQTASAQAVEAAYKSARGSLPTRPTVTTYRTDISPSSAMKAGAELTWLSQITAVAGQSDAIREVREDLVLYSPDGKEFKRASKVAGDRGGSGSFENSFKLVLPTGAQQGIYTARSQLFLNGQVARDAQVNFQVVNISPDNNYLAKAALD